MDGILNVFQGISGVNKTHLPVFTSALREQQSFRLGINSSVISHVTSLLSKSTTSYEGLLLLEPLLEQCSLEFLEQKGVLWTTLCIKICHQKSQERDFSNVLAYNAICILLEKSVDIPELSKSYSGTLILKIIETLKNVPSSSHLAALKCVEKCIKLYPGATGVCRATVEKYIFSFIDTDDEKLSIMSAKCIHLLQQVRKGSNQGTNPKETWQANQIKLLGSLHELLDSIYANCSEFYDCTVPSERLDVAPLNLSTDPVNRALQLFTRFRNLVNLLQVCIREPFPVSKNIMPGKILNLVERCLAVNCKILEKNSISDNLAIGALLPAIHVQIYKLVNTLIVILKSHMAIHVNTILNLVTGTLKWTSPGKSVGYQKPYTNLRIAAYKTLTIWCETMRYGSSCETIAEEVIEQINYDITPYHSEVTLKVLSGSKKHMSKKARKLLHKAQNEESNLTQTHSKVFNPHHNKFALSDAGNDDVCISALSCLNKIILYSTCFLKPTTIKDLQGKIAKLVVQVSNYEFPKGKLYSNHFCRKNLFEVLNSLVIASHHLCPPPLQLAAMVFSASQITDVSLIVRDACSTYSKNLEKIIHPEKGCLYFPPDENLIKKVFKNIKRKRVLSTKILNNEEIDASTDDDDEIYKDAGREKKSKILKTAVEVNEIDVIDNLDAQSENNDSSREIEENESLYVSDTEIVSGILNPAQNKVEIPVSSKNTEISVEQTIQCTEQSEDLNCIEKNVRPKIHNNNNVKEIKQNVDKINKNPSDENEIIVSSEENITENEEELNNEQEKNDEKNTDDIPMELDEDTLVQQIVSTLITE